MKLPNNLLKKMLLIENLGEILYSNLYLKAKDEDSRTIYKKLSINEQETGVAIREYSLKNNFDLKMFFSNLILLIADVVFKIVSEKQLLLFLRNILKKRIYLKYYEKYKNYYSQELWNILLDHEKFQHKLLNVRS